MPTNHHQHQVAHLERLDSWMASATWHPRIVPMAVYLLFLLPITTLMPDYLWLYPPLYVIQCSIVGWLLWRYRRLLPELTLSFHWLVLPTAITVTVSWIALGWLMAGEWALRWDAIVAGQPLGFIDYADQGLTPGYLAVTDENFLKTMQAQPWLYGLSLGLRLLGMAMLVPLFEELFIRSLCLRALHRARETGVGLLQVLHDMPVVGDWFMHTERGRLAAAQPSMFVKQFSETPLGALTVFGVVASTFIFTVNHTIRDWPGCIVCALVWCALLWYTNRPGKKQLGLGPIIWSHGLCNALLWAYTIYTDDWQFL
jgi:hypothetical protein